MKEVLLTPIKEHKSDVALLEERLLSLWRKEVYLPLLRALNKPVKILNSQEDLIAAILSGQIRYEDGGFVGGFTSEVSRELRSLGAVWSKRFPKWLIREELLSADINIAIQKATIAEQGLKFSLSEVLSSIVADKVANKFTATSLFKIAVGNTERDFRKSVAGVAIAPKFSSEAKESIAKDYSNNLKLYIRDFTEEQTLKLRKEIETHVYEGGRYEGLVKKIKASYGVTQRKAKFLARQETSLLTAKIRQTRYEDVGLDDYIWQTVAGTPAHPVRELHKKLKGTRQKFSDPPVSGPQGQKQNPGEPYNCRCVARVIAKTKP